MFAESVSPLGTTVAPGIVAVCGLEIILATIFLIARLFSYLTITHSLQVDDCMEISGSRDLTYMNSYVHCGKRIIIRLQWY